jgi:thymidylate kinase
LTFILDLDPQLAQKRLWKRKAENGKYANWNQLDLHFHGRIRNHYLQLKQRFPHRTIKIINADQGEETLAEEVINTIKEIEK